MQERDFSSYDKPVLSTEKEETPSGGGGFGGGSVLDAVKPWIGKIIAIAVIAVVALFAYNYFIGSIASVSITVKDFEGNHLSDSSIRVFEQGSGNLVFSESGQATYSTELRMGSYRVEVAAPDYKEKTEFLNITDKVFQETITLGKNFRVKIESVELPANIFAGQKVDGIIRLRNDKATVARVELVFEDDFEGLGASTSVPIITVPGNQVATIAFSVEVPSDAEIKSKRKGDEKKGKVRVKYSNEKEEVSFRLWPNPRNELSISKADFGTVTLEETEIKTKTKDLTIKNNNDFDVRDLELRVEVQGYSNNSKEEIESWFQFIPSATIAVLAEDSSEKNYRLRVVVPPTAQPDVIDGIIVLDADYLEEPVINQLSLEVEAAN